MRKLILTLLAVLSCGLLFQPFAVCAAETEDTQTVYGIGSVSKVFGAAAVMLLADRGEVVLDAPVTDYIPEFKMADERYRQITVRMLLNHSSGLMGTTFLDSFLLGESDINYREVLLENLKSQVLKADPGAFSVYCNDGFTLAEIIVERVSHMSFAAFIEKEFSQPLGLTHTFMPEDIPDPQTALPLYYNDRRLPYENIRSLASGGIYSTAQDLCRFSRIFTDKGGGILSEAAVRAMAYPEYQNNRICVQAAESNFGYGLGWDSVDSYPFLRYGITALSKGGNTDYYNAALMVLPEQALSVAITSSGGKSELCLMLASEIITEVLKEEGLITEEQEQEAAKPAIDVTQQPAPIPETLKKYAGIYASGEIWKLDFTEHDTARLTSLENGKDMVQEYSYTTEGNFVSTDGKYISYTGLAQASGGIQGLTSFHFSEESNGKTYMLGTTYTMAGGRVESVIAMPFAEKIEENQLTDAILQTWKARDGQKYYRINDAFNAGYYLQQPSMKLELMSALPGYTCATKFYKNCRIIDQNNAVCELELPIMTGRDLAGYHFYQEDGTEYLQLEAYQYIGENAIPALSRQTESIVSGPAAQWYRIGPAEAGRVISVELPENSAYYVYDENDVCTASSLFADEKDTVLLPENGKLMLTAPEGKTIRIIWREQDG